MAMSTRATQGALKANSLRWMNGWHSYDTANESILSTGSCAFSLPVFDIKNCPARALMNMNIFEATKTQFSIRKL